MDKSSVKGSVRMHDELDESREGSKKREEIKRTLGYKEGMFLFRGRNKHEFSLGHSFK